MRARAAGKLMTSSAQLALRRRVIEVNRAGAWTGPWERTRMGTSRERYKTQCVVAVGEDRKK